jgi:hypothetical protein
MPLIFESLTTTNLVRRKIVDTSLSPEKRIAQKMTDLSVTADFLGQLTVAFGFRGLPQPRISQALRGTKPFSNEQGTFLLKLLTRLEGLRAVLQPFEIALTNPTSVKGVLDDIDRGALAVLIIKPESESEETKD